MAMKRLPVFLLSLAASVVLPSAHADTLVSYDLNFTYTGNLGGLTTPTGSFTYDVTTQSFVSFAVVLGSETFDMTSAMNSASLGTYSSPCTPTSIFDAVVNYGSCAHSFSVSNLTNPYPYEDLDFLQFGFPNLPQLGFVSFATVSQPGAGLPANAHGYGTYTATEVSSTPEPGSLWLLGTGTLPAAGLALRRRPWARG